MATVVRDKVRLGSEGGNEKKTECEECNKDVVKEGVECEVCERWFHGKCAGVAAGTYKALEQDKALHWYCRGCSKGVVSTWKRLQEKQEVIEKEVSILKEEFKEIREKWHPVMVEKLESGMENNKKELGDLEKRVKIVEDFEKDMEGKKDRLLETSRKEVKELEKKVKKLEEAVKEREAKKEQIVLKEVQGIKESFVAIVQEQAKEQEIEREKEQKTKEREMQQKMLEMMEREKRRNNMIIRGIKESNDQADRLAVDRVLGALVEELEIKYEIIGRVGRLDKENEVRKDRPLRIRIEDIEDKRRLLSRSKKLKESKDEFLHKVYMAPDMTRIQQEEDKTMRDKLKEIREKDVKDKVQSSVKIAKGEIVRVHNGVKEVLFTLKR